MTKTLDLFEILLPMFLPTFLLPLSIGFFIILFEKALRKYLFKNMIKKETFDEKITKLTDSLKESASFVQDIQEQIESKQKLVHNL